MANSALGRRFPDRVEAATGAEFSDFLPLVCASVPFINLPLTGVRRLCQYNGSPRTPNAQPPARQFYCIAARRCCERMAAHGEGELRVTLPPGARAEAIFHPSLSLARLF